MNQKALTLLWTVLLLSTMLNPVFAQGTAFTYQGKLNSGGGPANGSYDLRFIVYDNNSSGTQQGPIVTNLATGVSNGLFTVTLDFGNVFPAASRYLEIAVRTNGNGSFTTLSPRQLLTPTPYAITAGNVISGGLAAGTYGSALTLNNAANQFTGGFSGNGANVSNVNAISLGGIGAPNFWQFGGNNVAGGNFLGSTNNQAVEIRANNLKVMQFAYASNGVSGYSPNVIGGNGANSVGAGVVGATISGGGLPGFLGPNFVGADFGTVVGGSGSSANGRAAIAGGGISAANGQYSVAFGGFSLATGNYSVAMGQSTASGANSTAFGNSKATNSYATAMGQSTASGVGATAMGGSSATNDNATAMGSSLAGGFNSTAMGGEGTSALGDFSIAGGFNSVATGDGATAFGTSMASGGNSTALGVSTATGYVSSAIGNDTTAAGQSSVAIGYRAQALHDGSFVFGDLSQSAYFNSTSPNQFLIRATGGVGIGLNNPSAALHVASPSSAPEFHVTQLNSSDSTRLRMNVNGYQSWEMDVSPGPSPQLQFWNNTLRAYIDFNGNVTANTFNPASDRNLKENFNAISSREVLDKVAAMPITEWNFKSDTGVRHIGPMAQDFYAAFNVGMDDRHIATVDEGGVALAAIQGLNQKLDEKDAQIRDLKQSIEELKKMVSQLAQMKAK